MEFEPTVFVVDDDASIRKSLTLLCGTVNVPVRTFAAVQEFLDEHNPEWRGCVILDVRMPGGSGLGLLDRLRELQHDIPVIVLTGFGEVPQAVRAMKQGAIDFVVKNVADQELLDKIQAAMQRDAEKYASRAKHMVVYQKMESLTDREREVMDLVVDGLSSKEIANQLGISFKTIEAHRARIMKKMQVRSVTHLIRVCLELQIDRNSRNGV